MKQLAVIIPAYNESDEIASVIRAIPNRVSVDQASFSVVPIVVNDNSKDDTSQRAAEAGATVVSHIMNSGAGAATRTGLRYVQQELPDVDYVVTIDADGQHDTADIQKLLSHAMRHSSRFIVGSRLHAGNKESMPLHRRFGNIGLSLISRILFGIKTRDTQSGLRLISADALSTVSDYTIDRYGFCTEMLWLANRSGIKIEEVPIAVKYSDDTLNKGQNNWGVVHLVLDLLWIRISR